MDNEPTERDLREKLAETAIRAYRRGLVAGTGGNISARLPDRNEVLITPTGVSLEMTTPDNIVKTDLHSVPVDPSAAHGPSKETGFHCAIYRTRPTAQAIVHAHPPFATAFSHRFEDLPMSTVSASVVLKRVPCVDVALSGSSELAGLVEVAFSLCFEVRAILLRAHGIISTGSDLVEAYDLADLVEDTARVAFLSLGLGVPLAEMVDVALRPLRKG